jgi:hypothetical protein
MNEGDIDHGHAFFGVPQSCCQQKSQAATPEQACTCPSSSYRSAANSRHPNSEVWAQQPGDFNRIMDACVPHASVHF